MNKQEIRLIRLQNKYKLDDMILSEEALYSIINKIIEDRTKEIQIKVAYEDIWRNHLKEL